MVTVHLKTDALPTVSPETPDEALEMVVTTPVPEVVVHAPVPGEGLLPAKVAVVALHNVCAVPALAVTGEFTVVDPVADVTQAPLVIVQV